MKYTQKKFFDETPVLYPWPTLLRNYGYSLIFKPRDLKFRQYLDKLRLRPKDKILEIGSGDGVFADRISKTYKVRIVGIDISPKSIKRARLDSSTKNIYKIGNASDLGFKKNSFDVLLCFDTLEHVVKSTGRKKVSLQKKALQEMARVLKPGGRMVLYTINAKQKFTLNWVLSRFGINVFNDWDHDPKFFLDSNWCADVLNKNGLKIIKLEYFNAFFTLLFDEAIMVKTLILNKLGLNQNKGYKRYLGEIFLRIFNLFSILVMPVSELVDKLWTSRGYSNSFFIYAKKK